MQRLALDPDGIAALAHDALLRSVGAWSMGVQGAIGEFAVVAGEVVSVQRAGRTIEARTAGGGVRLKVVEEAGAFSGEGTVWFTVPRRVLADPAAGVTVTGTDPEALDVERRGDLLADLAIGHAAARFAVRTADPDLGQRLRSIEGAAWADALAAVGPALAAASPHRIVTTPLGRIEVYSPIPPPGGVAPDGPHTHLLPALLRTGRELPPRVALPPDLAPAAAFHPPPGWNPPT